jgi:mannose-6-phosphate isomerase-like protein (cupin superfamily)
MNRLAIIPLVSCVVLAAAGCQRDPDTTTQTTPATSAEQTGQPGQVDDHGTQPWVVDIEEATLENTSFRVARWTGASMQMTLMSIKAGEEIGLEKHDGMDQFIRIEQGTARVRMGRTREDLTFDREVSDDWAIFIPGGYWHNVMNIGQGELKLYSIYSPPEHPAGTVHRTREEAEAAEHDHRQ